jgi:hypothetical protein
MSTRLWQEQFTQPQSQVQPPRQPLVFGMSMAAELELPVATSPTSGPEKEVMVELAKQDSRN